LILSAAFRNLRSLAQRLAKMPRYAGLAPYVADVRRTLGRVPKVLPEKATPDPTTQQPS
jgi:hypothetical protein